MAFRILAVVFMLLRDGSAGRVARRVAALEQRDVGRLVDIDDDGAGRLVTGVAGRLAGRSRIGHRGLARGRVADGRLVRVPVPVPVRRGEHGQGMGDVEPQW